MTLGRQTIFTIILQVTTMLGVACGSRAGNPKKPDTNNAALPNIAFGMTEVKEPDVSGAEFPGGKIDTSSFSTPAPRLAKTLETLNALSIKLNAEKLPVGEAFKIKAKSGTLTGLIQMQTSGDYQYNSVFCVDDEPFLEVKWSDSKPDIYIQRDFNFYPFGVEENVENVDTLVELDLKKSETQPKEVLDVRFQSTPEKKDIFIQNAETYVDHIRYQGDGEKNVLARGQQYWATSGEVLKGPFDPQIHFNARLDSIGTAKIVFHHANLGVFCPQTFDSENLENPGWCLGVKIDSDNKLSFLNKTEVDTAWLEIKTVGLPVHSDIRLLGIKATCPTIK